MTLTKYSALRQAAATSDQMLTLEAHCNSHKMLASSCAATSRSW